MIERTSRGLLGAALLTCVAVAFSCGENQKDGIITPTSGWYSQDPTQDGKAWGFCGGWSDGYGPGRCVTMCGPAATPVDAYLNGHYRMSYHSNTPDAPTRGGIDGGEPGTRQHRGMPGLVGRSTDDAWHFSVDIDLSKAHLASMVWVHVAYEGSCADLEVDDDGEYGFVRIDEVFPTPAKDG